MDHHSSRLDDCSNRRPLSDYVCLLHADPYIYGETSDDCLLLRTHNDREEFCFLSDLRNQSLSDSKFRACLWTEDARGLLWEPITYMWKPVVETLVFINDTIRNRECLSDQMQDGIKLTCDRQFSISETEAQLGRRRITQSLG
jgi:hypothetical protein